MKLIIDIPEDVYTRLFDNGIQDNEIAVDDVCEMARALRLGKPLPNNPTNGDVIKAMFPTADITIIGKLGEAGRVFVHHKDDITIYNLDWWNAPYREDGD